ncbi:3-keto-disaccharide hydrolase [Spirosoma fluviale]|uniref:3-keto-alpha-glucoside-1,2-lyase/3-keto-2-hydroxy-glucal hydratase domain-containing protein n=1 Tax=Spirosoma fluviale TaxID=1597977 RepID=A0A286F760_9BACT|nr:DUF1080 domain-containing protein [Spirosoma fluviale]SOD79023.1 protein of unknown function [Spirosoma fluviale]
MKKLALLTGLLLTCTLHLFAQTSVSTGPASTTTAPVAPPKGHPNSSGAGWKPLFASDLSDAGFPKGVWSFDDGGVLTATADVAIWTAVPYDDFVLDLLFKTADGTNSGVVVHASDTTNWIPNSVEIQIADDYAKKWADSPTNWQCGAFFGHQAATKQQIVKKPDEWNRYTITCQGKMIYVVLNNQLVNTIDLSKFTSAKTNPDGSEVPSWLNKAPAELPLHGYIGLQGKHAGAPIYFRNLKIKAL